MSQIWMIPPKAPPQLVLSPEARVIFLSGQCGLHLYRRVPRYEDLTINRSDEVSKTHSAAVDAILAKLAQRPH